MRVLHQKQSLNNAPNNGANENGLLGCGLTPLRQRKWCLQRILQGNLLKSAGAAFFFATAASAGSLAPLPFDDDAEVCAKEPSFADFAPMVAPGQDAASLYELHLTLWRSHCRTPEYWEARGVSQEMLLYSLGCHPTELLSCEVGPTPVPLPAGVWLMLGALGLGFAFSRRRASSADNAETDAGFPPSPEHRPNPAGLRSPVLPGGAPNPFPATVGV